MHADTATPEPGEQRFLRGQTRLLEMIAGRQELPLVLRELALLIESEAPGTRASLLLLEDGHRLRHGAAPNLPEAYNRAIDGLEIGPSAGSCGTAAFTGKTVVVEDIASHPGWVEYRALAEEHGLRSCWSTPIRGADGQVLGTFALYTGTPRPPTPAEQRLVDAAIHIAQVAIEHDRTERALRRSDARSVSVLQTSLDCIIIMDGAGVVTEWNPACEATFGYSRDEAVGRDLASLIIPPRFREAHLRGLRHYLATGEGPVLNQRLELSAVDKAEREFPVELAIIANRVGDEIFFTGHIRDITARKRAEQELQEQTRLARLSADVALALTRSEPLPSILQRCCEIVVDRLDAAVARVWLLNEQEQLLELVASAGTDMDDDPQRRVPLGRSIIGKIAQQREPYLTNELEQEGGGDVDEAPGEGLVAFAGYPLLVDGRPVGVIAMYTRHPLSEPALNALGTAAHGVAIGVARKRVEDALRDSEEHYRFLAATIPVQVWTARPDGTLSYVAPQVAQYFGTSTETITGEGWMNFVHPDDLSGAVERWTRSLQTGEPYEVQFRLLEAATGEYRCHIARAVPMRDSSGTITRWFGTNTDIEDQQRAQEVERRLLVEQVARQEAEKREDTLRHYADELERSNQELQSFAYVASHDLQEPLRKIQAFGDVLAQDFSEALGVEGVDFLQRMQNAAARMQTLINDLLSFSRVTSRAQPFQRVDLNRVAREALDTLELRAEESGAEIEVGPLPTIEADPTQLLQLFQNLLGNALKFRRPEVAPRIRVTGTVQDGWCEIRVEDNGIGFDERYLDRIFSIFQRLHSRSGYEGTGVGLAICRKIVERHGGSITAHSAPGEGATFVARLPLTPPSREKIS